MNRQQPTWRHRWIGLVGAFLVPLIFAAGFLVATHGSGDRLPSIQAAVVNLDEPVTIDGQIVPLGRQLAGGLVEGDPDDPDTNFTWQLTDAADSRAGLDSGRYSAVVVIPADFSAAATSYGDEDPQRARQATLQVETSRITGIADAAIGRTIAQTATRTLNTALTKAYLDNIYLGFNAQGEQLSTVADGASRLADGSKKVGEGLTAAAEGAEEFSGGLSQLDAGGRELADAGRELSSGGSDLAAGTRTLATRTADLPTQTRQLATGTRAVADGARQLSTGTAQLAAGSADLSNGAAKLAPGASAVAGGLRQLDQQLPALTRAADDAGSGAKAYADGASEFARGAQQYAAGLEQFASGLQSPTGLIPCQTAGIDDPQVCAGFIAGQNASGRAMQTEQDGQSLVSGAKGLGRGGADLGAGGVELAAGVQQFSTGVGRVAEGIGGLSTGADQVADGAAGLRDGAAQLATGATEVDRGVGPLAQGADRVATGTEQLAEGMGPLSEGIAQTAAGVGRYTEGVSQYTDGVAQLSGGIGQAAEGGPGLVRGLRELAQGQGDLTRGTRDLADGLARGASQVPTFSAQDRENLTAVVAAPVAPQSAQDTSILPAVSSTSLLMVVALWLGGLVSYLVVRPIPTRALTSSEPSWRLTLSGLLPGVALAALQAAVITVLANQVLGVNPIKLGAVLGVSLLAAVTFATVNHALTAWFGGAGRLISVAFVVLTAASGIISAVPAFFDAVRPFNPLTPGLDAVRAVVTDGPGLGGALGLLMAWLIVAAAASQLAIVRSRAVSPGWLARHGTAA